MALKTLYERKGQINDVDQKISKLKTKIDSIDEYLNNIKANLAPQL